MYSRAGIKYHYTLFTLGRKRRHRVAVVANRISEVTLTNETVTLSEIKLAKDTANTLVNTTV